MYKIVQILLPISSFLLAKDANFILCVAITMAQFLYVIRKRIKITPEKSIYLFVQNHIIPGNKFLSSIYEKHAEEDGFLYITYSGENVFG